MSSDESMLTSFNDYLLENSGVLGAVLNKARDDEHTKPYGSLFFKPYESTQNFFSRALTSVTGPVYFSILAAESALVAIAFTLKSLVSLLSFDGDSAMDDLKTVAECSFAFLLLALSAIASPIANLVDLIGGGVSGLMHHDEEQDWGTKFI